MYNNSNSTGIQSVIISSEKVEGKCNYFYTNIINFSIDFEFDFNNSLMKNSSLNFNNFSLVEIVFGMPPPSNFD